MRAAVGPVSEASIYTHGNLAEAYLHVLHELPLGLLHERRACLVAVEALGADHPNAARKLKEFADVLAQMGMPELADPVRRGALEAVTADEIALRLDSEMWRGIISTLSRPRKTELRRRLAEAKMDPNFWKHMGMPQNFLEDS